jgi:hypothetical protein
MIPGRKCNPAAAGLSSEITREFVTLSEAHEMAEPEHEGDRQCVQDPPARFPQKESMHALLLFPQKMSEQIDDR